MATVKEIIQQFCYLQNISAPSSIVGVAAPTERQLLAVFAKVGNRLRNKPYDWPQLKRNYQFTTSTDVRRYRLPGDFYRLMFETQMDTTNQWSLVGPVSDRDMASRQYTVVEVSTRKAYRIIGPTSHLFSTSPYAKRAAGIFEIDPAGENDTDVLSLDYISSNWIWPRDWVTGTSYSAGDIRSGDGYVYRTAAGGTAGATRPSHSTGSASDGTVTWTVYTEPYLVEPANAALNDDDLCLFDTDVMVEGMRWAYEELKGRDFLKIQKDWDDAVDAANARFQGVERGSMCGGADDDSLWPLVPEGGWSV